MTQSISGKTSKRAYLVLALNAVDGQRVVASILGRPGGGIVKWKKPSERREDYGTM